MSEEAFAPVRAMLDELDDLVARLTKLPIPEELTPDAVGRMRFAGKRLYEAARNLLAEADPARGAPIKGEGYQLASSRRATRTYNTPRIMSDFMTATGLDAGRVLGVLRDRGAVKINWTWTKLKEAFAEFGISFMVEPGLTIDDDTATLDTAHVGEVWETKTELEKAPEE